MNQQFLLILSTSNSSNPNAKRWLSQSNNLWLALMVLNPDINRRKKRKTTQKKSKKRVRVEHAFGFMEQCMKGLKINRHYNIHRHHWLNHFYP